MTKWHDLDGVHEAMLVFPEDGEEFTFSPRAVAVDENGQGVSLTGMPSAILRVKRVKASVK